MHIVKVRILNIFRALCCRLFHPEARKISFFSAVCIGVWAPLFAADLPHGGSVTGGQAVITQQTHSVEVFQRCLAPYICPLIFGFSNKVSGTGGRMFNAW